MPASCFDDQLMVWKNFITTVETVAADIGNVSVRKSPQLHRKGDSTCKYGFECAFTYRRQSYNVYAKRMSI